MLIYSFAIGSFTIFLKQICWDMTGYVGPTHDNYQMIELSIQAWRDGMMLHFQL